MNDEKECRCWYLLIALFCMIGAIAQLPILFAHEGEAFYWFAFIRCIVLSLLMVVFGYLSIEPKGEGFE